MGTNLVLLFSRILISPIMFVYGAQKLLDINNFLTNPATKRMMETFMGGATPPLWFAYANALFQLVAGLCILVGFKTRFSALLTVIWLIPVTYFGHPFWAGIDPVFNEPQFYKNLAIIGGYMMIASLGAGKFSVDGLMNTKHSVSG